MTKEVADIVSEIVAHKAMKLYIQKLNNGRGEPLVSSMHAPKNAYNKGIDDLCKEVREALKSICE